MNRRILCVDDEPRVLDGLQRALGDRFDVTTAESGADGLQILTAEGYFAVVVSDMRMPYMDGTDFLSRVQKLRPDTTRVLLTGQTDIAAAIDAVNNGGIFRFLCKPCSAENLERALDAGIEQHRMRRAEAEVLEQTVSGILRVLSDILGLVAPTLFSRSTRLRDVISHLVRKLGLAEPWQYEVAATLSHVGLVAVPADVIARALAGKQLTDAERKQFASYPAVGHRILAQIPRLERVAAMIRDQRHPDSREIAPVVLGANMLKVATELEGMLGRGVPFQEALEALPRRGCDPQLVGALKDYRAPLDAGGPRSLLVLDLKPGMVLDADVRIPSGPLVMPKGSALTVFVIDRIRKIAETIGIEEPVHVRSSLEATR